MKKTKRSAKSPGAARRKVRAVQAEARIKKAEARIEQIKAREEQAKAREEQAKAREEQARAQAERVKVQAEQANVRAEQAERALQRLFHKSTVLPLEPAPRLLKQDANSELSSRNLLGQLTERQREILRLIAEGQNTKQIAHLLNVSPKTVEYHRMKLMAVLNLRDIPSLVRFAIKAGLITPDN